MGFAVTNALGQEVALTRITRGVSANRGVHRYLFRLAFSFAVETVFRRTSENPRSRRGRYKSSRSSGGTRPGPVCGAPRSRSHTVREGALLGVRPWSHSCTALAWGGDPSNSSPSWTPFGSCSHTNRVAAHKHRGSGAGMR